MTKTLRSATDRVAQSVGHLTRNIPGNILSFLLPLFQEGQLSVTVESMCTKYWHVLSTADDSVDHN